MLNLTTIYPSHVDMFANYTDGNILEAFYKNSPWPKCWNLLAIGQRSYQVREGHVIEFFLQMSCDVNEVNPQVLKKSLQNALSKFWVLRTNMTTLKCNQQLQRQGEVMVHQSTRFKPLWHGLFLKHQDIQANVSEDLLYFLKSSPIWKILYLKRSKMKTYLNIPKHFFCPLIELRPWEYELIQITTTRAVITMSEKVLFESEFTITTPWTGNQTTVRICLEDSDLDMISNVACDEVVFWKTLIFLTFWICTEKN